MIGGIAGIGSLTQIELRKQSILRIEAQVHGHCFAEAAQGDKSSRDGDAAERDLRRQQNIAKGPAASRDGLASAALNRLIWIGLEYLPQRHYSKHNAGGYRDKERHEDQRRLRQYEEFHRISSGWMPTSKAGEGHPRQAPGARAPENRNHKGLDQKLAKDAPAARSKGHADGNLPRAICRTRCEQAAEVGAGGEQHNSS